MSMLPTAHYGVFGARTVEVGGWKHDYVCAVPLHAIPVMLL